MVKSQSNWRKEDPVGWKITDVNVDFLINKIQNDLQKNSFNRAQKNGAVVFDLDGTLFNVNYRTFEILQKWFKSLDRSHLTDDVLRKISNLSLAHIGYSVKDSFQNLELDLDDNAIEYLYKSTNKYWKRNFFSGKWALGCDKPYEGAVLFAQRLHEMGLHIFYLSGRHKKSLETSTLEQLKKHGFPLERSLLILKDFQEMDDHSFKSSQLAILNTQYHILANFENEYANIAAMAMSAANCMHIIVDSPHSDKFIPSTDLCFYRISGFT